MPTGSNPSIKSLYNSLWNPIKLRLLYNKIRDGLRRIQIILYQYVRGIKYQVRRTREVIAYKFFSVLDGSRLFPTDQPAIRNWKLFSMEVRRKKNKLFDKASCFPDSIFIAGCQRSGTTMLSRIITQSDPMVNYWTQKDEELDAALLLSGNVPKKTEGRYCFQTTYLNENYCEYYDVLNSSSGNRLVWVIRNPFSVIFSMLYNWDSFALNELFASSGHKNCLYFDRRHFRKPILSGNKKLNKACCSYISKTSQLFDLVNNIEHKCLYVVDYDDFVTDKKEALPLLYQFLNIEYDKRYADMISRNNVSKYNMLSSNEKKVVYQYCWPIYQQAKSLMIQLKD